MKTYTLKVPVADLEIFKALIDRLGWEIVLEGLDSLKTAIRNIMTTNWLWTPEQADWIVPRMEILPVGEYIQKLQATDIIITKKDVFEAGMGECFVLDQEPYTYKDTDKFLFDTDFSPPVDYTGCVNRRDQMIRFIQHIEDLKKQGRKFHIPGFEYFAWVVSNYDKAPAGLITFIRGYALCAGSCFCNRYGNVTMPSIYPRRTGLDPYADGLSNTPSTGSPLCAIEIF
jgi:hypothetical protein